MLRNLQWLPITQAEEQIQTFEHGPPWPEPCLPVQAHVPLLPPLSPPLTLATEPPASSSSSLSFPYVLSLPGKPSPQQVGLVSDRPSGHRPSPNFSFLKSTVPNPPRGVRSLPGLLHCTSYTQEQQGHCHLPKDSWLCDSRIFSFSSFILAPKTVLGREQMLSLSLAG